MRSNLLDERFPGLAEEIREAAAPEAGEPTVRERLGLAEAEAAPEEWTYGEVVSAGLEALGADAAGPRAAGLATWAAKTDAEQEGR
jgi:hypothetical protein